jgi:hypothetical protein
MFLRDAIQHGSMVRAGGIMMLVDVYIRADEGKERQYLVLPEGQAEMPIPAHGKSWRKLFVMSTDENSLEVPTADLVGTIKFKGFAILRPKTWSKDWSEVSDDELESFLEPDGWQDKWNLA